MRRFVAASLVFLSASGNFAFTQEPAASAPVAAPATVVAPTAIALTPAAAATAGPDAPSPATPDASGRYKLHEGEDVNLTFAQDLSRRPLRKAIL